MSNAGPNPSPIVPVVVGDAERRKAASDRLMSRHGLSIRPIDPTVAWGTERLRITPTRALREVRSSLDLPTATHDAARVAAT